MTLKDILPVLMEKERAPYYYTGPLRHTLLNSSAHHLLVLILQQLQPELQLFK